MTSSEQLLGLFPLGIVLLPGEVVPLHIFEERYKLLVERARSTAVSSASSSRRTTALRECGCTARVAEHRRAAWTTAA